MSTTDTKKTCVQKLIEQLMKKGYSQSDIAKKSGIAQPTISRALTGVHPDSRLSTYTKLKSLCELENKDSRQK